LLHPCDQYRFILLGPATIVADVVAALGTIACLYRLAPSAAASELRGLRAPHPLSSHCGFNMGHFYWMEIALDLIEYIALRIELYRSMHKDKVCVLLYNKPALLCK